MTDAELLAIIAQAEREGWTELDLSGKGLKKLPSEIGKLANLTTLDLSINQITAIPDEIANLTNLTEYSFQQYSMIRKNNYV
ncbi:leucine-rich repeat domain-containing protein [Pseudanabaena galeata UHCC 0370]|uniref:Leucine-rich repeat domain-containing protein n=1 Tax=Pseudanabaena galeata UHCC 0370 TaxID=3110310 RepID=A0ABU5TLM2_9CYAN|nr:leucine-rich repeat domain-containing protein [Pseudanabaena galeata]MEA5479230.1 leucine-rich repeat domain-containing protein [Pseudanabaena galeata UHCC 0370]